MKKHILLLLTLVPIAAGYILNLTILLPGIGMLIYYGLPVIVSVFWFWLGRQFARTSWNTLPAILIGNGAGIVSILIYLWQFLLETDETRNLALAGFSQMFSAAAPGFLLARLALLFEPEPNIIGMASAVALNVLSEVFLIAVFSAAVIFEKHRIRTESAR